MLSEPIVSNYLDIEYNRNGRLSPRQRAEFEHKELLYHLINIAVLVLGMAILLIGLLNNDFDLTEKFLTILFALPFFIVEARFYLPPSPFPDRVEKIQGVLEYLHDCGVPETGAVWEIHVRAHIFYTSDQNMAQDLQLKAEHIFYYVIHRRQEVLLAWEQSHPA